MLRPAAPTADSPSAFAAAPGGHGLRVAAPGPATVADWRAAYSAGASARELLLARLRHIQAREADKAWIHRVEEAALLQRLAELEQLAQRPELAGNRAALLTQHPLWGVPFALKDNIDVAGLPTTAACPAFAYQPETSAAVVRKLLAAGAVLLGKTNLDQFATGLVGTRSPYGAPASVYDTARISGGSSSGSAVVVARGDVAFALGTDTAGSGRVPAGFNHLVGLKPTPGRVSTAGVLPACRSLDCVSVLAHTVDDAAHVLAVIEGDDTSDSYSHFVPGPAQLGRAGRRLRVGVPAAPQLDTALGYDAAWQAAMAQLQAHDVDIVALDFTALHRTANLLYQGPWVAERHVVVQALLDQRPEAVEPTVAAVIAAARSFSATDTFRAQYQLRQAQQDSAALWQQVDLLMVPTAPTHPRFADVAADPLGANAQLGTYTNFVNLLGWCALALPAGFTPQGLPFGVTFIAAAQHDAALAGWGRRWWSAQADGAAPPTPRWPQSEKTLPIAVVGAHLSGLPLNSQLTERGATLREATTSAACYRLYALPNTKPRKPGLQKVASGGTAVALEVWDMPQSQVGSFLELIPSPLGLGSIELADGRQVHGFLCEAHALQGATDVSQHGGWRAYLASL